MSQEYALEWPPGGGAKLGGSLTFRTCAALFRELERHGADAPLDGPVDLSDVRAVDSAGLALLLEWQARQRKAGRGLVLHHAPDNLMRLAELADAVDLLGLQGREAATP